MTPRTTVLLITAFVVLGVSGAVITLLDSGHRDSVRKDISMLPEASRPDQPTTLRPASKPRAFQERADAPESRPASEPKSGEGQFSFQGHSIAEIMEEFKDIADAEGSFSVGQMSPFNMGLGNLYSFIASESPLVIKFYLQDFHEHYLSAPALAAYPEGNPDLAAWPAYEAWMHGALDLYMRLDRKWNGIAGNLSNKEWTSRHTSEEISEGNLRKGRLEQFKRDLGREIEQRGAPLFRKRAVPAPVSDR